MSAREVIASELARISRVDMNEAPPYTRASVRTAALHVARALTAAGYRIVGPDEVEAAQEVVEAFRFAKMNSTQIRAYQALIRAIASGGKQ